ncbi:hypothetical protein A7D17_14890 [Xanthomonas floridensis]|nr:hypothetical protein A7D17_14890 [Xanthomonas floridensis]
MEESRERYMELYEKLAERDQTEPGQEYWLWRNIQKSMEATDKCKIKLPDGTRSAVIFLKCLQYLEPQRFIDYEAPVCTLLLSAEDGRCE